MMMMMMSDGSWRRYRGGGIGKPSHSPSPSVSTIQPSCWSLDSVQIGCLVQPGSSKTCRLQIASCIADRLPNFTKRFISKRHVVNFSWIAEIWDMAQIQQNTREVNDFCQVLSRGTTWQCGDMWYSSWASSINMHKIIKCMWSFQRKSKSSQSQTCQIIQIIQIIQITWNAWND